MPRGTTVRWSAYEHVERRADWYWALAIMAGSFALIAVLFHDALFAVVVAVAAIAIALLAQHPPQLTNFELSERGIRVGPRLYRYDDIISFWVEDETGERPILLVDTTALMAPNLIIPIEHVDPDLVRAYLLEHADEVVMREPFAHRILEFFGI